MFALTLQLRLVGNFPVNRKGPNLGTSSRVLKASQQGQSGCAVTVVLFYQYARKQVQEDSLGY